MKVLILASLLCMLFASCYSAPSEYAEVLETLPEEEPIPANAVEDSNVLEPVMLEVEAREEVDEDNQEIARPLSFCPPGWDSHGRRCYKRISSRSWTSALHSCASYGGHLAAIKTASDYDELWMMSKFYDDSRYWLGGFKIVNTWSWLDGSPLSFTNGGSHIYGSTSYPCIVLNRGSNWHDYTCTNSYPAICVKNDCY